MAHGIDRIVGGEFGDRGRFPGDVDIERADHRRAVRRLDRHRAVACRHRAAAGHIDVARGQGDVDVIAVEFGDADGIAYRRDVAGRIEARSFDLETAEYLI